MLTQKKNIYRTFMKGGSNANEKTTGVIHLY